MQWVMLNVYLVLVSVIGVMISCAVPTAEVTNGDIISLIKELRKDVGAMKQQVQDFNGTLEDIEETKKRMEDKMFNMTQEIKAGKEEMSELRESVEMLMKFHTATTSTPTTTDAPTTTTATTSTLTATETPTTTATATTSTLTATETPTTTATVIPGMSKSSAVKSCKWLVEHYSNAKSGLYWISLGVPTQMYCDVESGGGGWTMIGNATIFSDSEAKQTSYNDFTSSDTSKLNNVIHKNFLLNSYGLTYLEEYIRFTQLRFYCHKPYLSRTVDIYTTNNPFGYAVVAQMTQKTSRRAQACDSYHRYADDNSNIGKHCAKWGAWDGLGGVGGDRMYFSPIWISGESYFNLDYGKWECDDWDSSSPRFSRKGQWLFYVR